MPPGQIIDFTRQDSGGLWIFFVCFAVLALTTTKKKDLVGGGFRKTGRVVLSKVIVGSLFATPLVLFLAVWQRLPPHKYFTVLRLGPECIVLGYRWPEPELVVPFTNIVSVRVIHEEGSYRTSGCHRVQIDTATERFRSFGYGRLTEVEYETWEKLKSVIEQQRQPKLRRQIIKNSPSVTSLP